MGVLQTIPALALLMFMIPLFGIGRPGAGGAVPLRAAAHRAEHARRAVRLEPQLLEMALVMGLRRWQRLWVELPLGSIAILAGIKTAAVVTVGTATLAAFIGGGGYGTLIVRGLALGDTGGPILAGAAPSAPWLWRSTPIFELLDRALSLAVCARPTLPRRISREGSSDAIARATGPGGAGSGPGTQVEWAPFDANATRRVAYGRTGDGA